MSDVSKKLASPRKHSLWTVCIMKGGQEVVRCGDQPKSLRTALFWNADTVASLTVAKVYTEKKNPKPPNHHASPSHLLMWGASKSSVVSAATPSSQISSCSSVGTEVQVRYEFVNRWLGCGWSGRE